MENRRSGILLHISSLPSRESIGTLGESAYRWIDLLYENSQTLWQILPLNPVGYNGSPYQSSSAFAGNPYFIDLWSLKESRLLDEDEFIDIENDNSSIDYSSMEKKDNLLRKAWSRFKDKESLERFRKEEFHWIEDFALFETLYEFFGKKSWTLWDSEYKFRDKEALDRFKNENKDEIEYRIFLQYLFFGQWANLKSYARERGVKIIGDMPIYVSYESADVWANPDEFLLDENLNPLVVAGVPPDYFSKTGQRWGNPIYNWEKMKEDNYSWWRKRISQTLKLYDFVRIDHFRGFAGYWVIPASDKTAVNGHWEKGVGNDFFEKMQEYFGELPFIAEDLGLITLDVIELRDRFNFPGMRVLQFAFDKNPSNPYLPHNHTSYSVLYTGTHDNDTLKGWFDSIKDKSYILEYIDSVEDDFLWKMIRVAQCSVSNWSILPLQDILGLDSSARMNTPGTVEGNWKWRCTSSMIQKAKERDFPKLKRFSKLYGRGLI